MAQPLLKVETPVTGGMFPANPYIFAPYAPRINGPNGLAPGGLGLTVYQRGC